MKKCFTSLLFALFPFVGLYAQSPCTITLSSGSSAQTVCLGDPVIPIRYNSQSSVTVNGLPPGVDYKHNSIVCCCAPCPDSYLEITDTARASGIYTYTVTGNYCTNSVPPVTGTITVSTSGACSKNCFANYSTTYDTTQNKFTLLVDPAVSGTNFNWDFGDGTSSTAIQPTHVYSVDTTYNVCLTVTTASNNTCTYCHKVGKNWKGNIFRTPGFTLTVVNTHNTVTDLEEQITSSTDFTISPNPSKGRAEIRFNKSVTKANINIYNSMGQKIIEQKNFSGLVYPVDLSHESAGGYLVEVVDENGKVAKAKVILQ